jgi:hypothetical protein
MATTPATLNRKGSNFCAPPIKKFIIKFSALVNSNKISAIVMQKEEALFLLQNRNNTKKTVRKNIQNNGLKKEKLKFTNSLKY